MGESDGLGFCFLRTENVCEENTATVGVNTKQFRGFAANIP